MFPREHTLSEERVEPGLVAILAAEIAGYSRLMGEDETGTLTRLTALRRELIDPKTAEHNGRLIKTTGDGLLIEFGSAVDAVRCGAEIQRATTSPPVSKDWPSLAGCASRARCATRCATSSHSSLRTSANRP